MKKKYIVSLTDEERKYLENIVNKGKNAAYRIKHANILLNAESDSTVWRTLKKMNSGRIYADSG